MTPSAKQELIYTDVKNSKENLAIQAGPGSGKTTTLLESLKLIPRLKKTIFLSFSNAIVNELKSRVPSYVKASTLHSLGCRMIMARFPAVKIEENKYFKLALPYFEKRTKETYKKAFTIQDICNYARLTLSPFDEQSLNDVCNKYGLDANPESILIASIILTDNTKLKNLFSIDFADMIFYPGSYPELINELFDYLFLDEAQDLNRCQAAFVGNLLKPETGRIIFVGDHRQSIFGFTGSDIDSFLQLQNKFNAKRLPLTVTYRCAKAIVRLAQTVYPDDIQEWENSPEGIVRRGDLREAEPGDMVICRNTKPLITAFFDFISRGKKAYVVGRDMEKGLIAFAESVAAHSIEKIEENIEEKLETLLDELSDDGIINPEKNTKYLSLLEKSDILLLILHKISNSAELVPRIKEIFHEDVKAIKLLTAHRCKGLECKRVFFIETVNKEKLLPSKYAISDEQKIQEQNLLFVVYTRAKEEFVFVDY